MADNKSGSRSVEQIEREIQDTRAQMGHTVDVLREKTSPARIRDKTVYRMKSRGNDLVTTVTEAMKRNPMLYGFLGSVLVWRLMAGSSYKEDRRSDRSSLETDTSGQLIERRRA